MAFNINKKLKENEINFISCWTNIYRLDNETQIFTNSVFPDDYFFNRIICGSSNLLNLKQAITNSKEFIKNSNQVGYFYLQHYFRYLSNYLEDNCFNYLDTHYTLISPSVFRSNSHDKHRMIMVKEIKTLDYWTEIYCKSFLIKEIEYVKKILQKHHKKFILLGAEITQKNKQVIVGCGLLFESDECLGLYCLGTLPNHRRKGIASKIIEKSIELSKLNGFDNIFLTTLLNDHNLDFYTKLNFKIVDKIIIYKKINNQ